MRCPECSKENPAEAAECAFCRCPLGQAATPAPPTDADRRQGGLGSRTSFLLLVVLAPAMLIVALFSGSPSLFIGFIVINVTTAAAPLLVAIGLAALVTRIARAHHQREALSGDGTIPPGATRPRTSGLALTSLVLPVLTVAAWIAVSLHLGDGKGGLWLLRLASPALALVAVGLIVGLVAVFQVVRKPNLLRGKRLAIAGIAVCLYTSSFVFLLLPRLHKVENTWRSNVCRYTNVKHLTRAIQMYRENWNDTFPPAGNWCDLVLPYVESEEIFVCPAAPGLRCGYAYNSALSRLRYDASTFSPSAIVIFESDAGWNAAGGPELLPAEPRHFGGDSYGFAGGDSFWTTRSRASDLQWQPILKEDLEHP